MARRNGFTLVELLSALVVGSLLLAFVAVALRGFEAQYVAHAGQTGSDRVSSIAFFLTSAIGQARPMGGHPALVGDDQHLRLHIPAPSALNETSTVQLDLAVELDKDGKQLVATLTSKGGSDIPAAAAAPIVLADGFKDIQIRYLRRTGDDARTTPRLVTFQFITPDGTILPLGIEPRLSSAGDCTFDQISLSCRH